MAQIYGQSISRISPLLTNSMAAILVQGILISCLTLVSLFGVLLLQPHSAAGIPVTSEQGLSWKSKCGSPLSFVEPFRVFLLLCLSALPLIHSDLDLCLSGTFSTSIFALGFTSSQSVLLLDFPRVCSLTFVSSFTSSLRPSVYSF